MARKKTKDGQVDMTPMIDVVFQLIIFFIVTIQMEKEYNRDIKMERAPDGPAIEGKQDPRTIVLEIDRRGWISIRGAQLSKTKLQSIMQNRYNRFGEFPVLIRADKRTRHTDVKSVMDICTGCGIWRINFAAIKEEKL